MREIKFRAWRIWDNRMIYDEVSSCISFRDNGEIETCSSVPLQFTGLLDKNGKEIYEGDILEDVDGNFPVFWNADCGVWATKDSDGVSLWLSDYLESVAIIGNIYENPELLKQ